ncbi:pilus assembly protein TadG-related protein [Massilia sp. CCM 8734]|uniref:pilus assembly protein TadG-related protein n=1 Tax=Massilia sp. CCM 8734 TaxID=2609283 RepID=UPI00141DECB0|nr:pilus assembly protein TadG-related protein [Massilia sp. CCM 8734]NHZ97503.1 hypothetical protein [Massilia sp. CCM 8734]
MKRSRVPPGRHQRGAYVIVFALLLMPLMLLGALAIDLSMAFMRRTDLQTAADAAAQAAARGLDGSAAGIDKANARAEAVIISSAVGYTALLWSPDALRFSDKPGSDADWLPASSANTAANASRMRYARIDTSELSSEFGSVRTVFARAIGSKSLYATLKVSTVAVAGRSQVQVTPLAVCALDNQRYGSRNNGGGLVEWIEHGFRRGVSYNLLDLNPGIAGAAPLNYQVNPVDFPPAAESESNRTLDALRPMVCSGTLALPFLPDNATVYVRQNFPPELAAQLNSRFGPLGAEAPACDRVAAPADTNIREFMLPPFWMALPTQPPTPTALSGSALARVIAGRRVTIADVSGATPSTDRTSYGPLWTFAKPLLYQGAAPVNTGAKFSKTNWATLYPIATSEQMLANASAPADGDALPYDSTLAMFRTAPGGASAPGLKGRRILNIPLLSCPVGADGKATVLAVGRFLMTSRASSTAPAVYGEFGGLAAPDSLSSATVLFR